jgi:hypothetical protein
MQSVAAQGVTMTVAAGWSLAVHRYKDITLAVSQNNESLFFTEAF